MRKVLGLFFKPFLKIPPIRRAYMGRLLTYLEETPASKLPAELRGVKVALERLPKAQRLAALEGGIQQAPEQVPQSRSLRRAAERQARRTR